MDKPIRKDLVQEDRATRRLWPITEEMRQKMVNKAMELMEYSKDERVQARAVSIGAQMVGQNIKIEQHEDEQVAASKPVLHVHASVTVTPDAFANFLADTLLPAPTVIENDNSGPVASDPQATSIPSAGEQA